MNIQELSDTELNLAMIWAYPNAFTCLTYESGTDSYTGFCANGNGANLRVIDFTGDWNLTMPLAFERGLTITPEWSDESYSAATYDEAGKMIHDAAGSNPLRAICEVLLMIYIEGKK